MRRARVASRLAAIVIERERSAAALAHFRAMKISVMPAKAGIHVSATPPYDAGFPLSRE